MKFKFTIILVLLLVVSGFAQNGINYKALIKDATGNILASSPISIQFIIYEGAALTNNVYQESHTTNTDANGFVIVNIGEGTTADVFNGISWSSDEHFLNVQINIGMGLVDLGTTAFKTVPYAKVAENVSGLEAIDEGNGMGWRLVGRNPDFLGDIGLGAVDFSESDSDFAEYGAVGTNAVAFGFRTRAESFSTAMGFDATASGISSMAFGNETTASGLSATAIGSSATAEGEGSTSIGIQTFASGERSMALGSESAATGRHAITLGHNVRARSFGEIALGTYTTAYTPVSTTNFNASDRLLVVGNGNAANNASDALILYKNGAFQVGEESEASGLVATAFGFETTASGDRSTAMGSYTTASNLGATALGNFTVASGINANAIGFETLASGNRASAFGTSSTASGLQAITLGTVSLASGENAIATGYGTRALSFRETTAGIYTTDYTPSSTTSFISSDRLFVIGNGTGSSSRSNAVTVLKNGNVGIGTSIPQERLHIANGILRIGTETLEDTGSNQLSVGASLIPDANNAYRLGNSSSRWIGVWAVDGTINTSDRRDKENITELNYGLQEIKKLKPVSFNWKKRPEAGTKLGLIAQDLEEIIPEVVMSQEVVYSEDDLSSFQKKQLDRLGVYYSDLIPVLIKAIQEQQDIIDSQHVQISTQSLELSVLRSDISAIQKLLALPSNTAVSSENTKE